MYIWAKDVPQVADFLPGMQKKIPWVRAQYHIFRPCRFMSVIVTFGSIVRVSQLQGLFGIQRNFESTLGYIKLSIYLKNIYENLNDL